MGRAKRSSAAPEQAELRSAAMRSIDENMDLGNGLKLADYDQLIQTVRGDIATYNELLSDSEYRWAHHLQQGGELFYGL
jgi:hypothetical protein